MWIWWRVGCIVQHVAEFVNVRLILWWIFRYEFRSVKTFSKEINFVGNKLLVFVLMAYTIIIGRVIYFF